jgi:hypothetical protein
MLKLRTILVYFSLLLFAGLIHAQGTVQASLQAGQGGGVGSGSSNGTVRVETTTGMAGSVGTFFFSPDGVPGQPFSADTVDETDKFLADGNHIHRETHGKIFRDSQGRTRTETEIEGFVTGSDPLVHITIMDPVEGRFIMLDPRNKTAIISSFGRRALNSEPVTPRPTAKPGQNMPAEVSQSPGLSGTAGQVRGGSISMGKRSTEDLGTTTVEGFTVSGKRVFRTMAAGTMGNDKPITTSSELWHSSDLKMDLLTISENPESGKHVRKIVNIHTGDPDPLLFQVPADFTVKETPQN